MGSILVTGSNGFIARYVLESLSTEHHVYGCSIENKAINTCEHYIRWDLSRDEEPKDLQGEEFDCIVHMAASLDLTGLSSQLISVNCFGTFNVLKLAINHRVNRIVYFSSMPVVGNQHTIPITESVVLNPPTLYHATKASGELIITQAKHYGIETVTLRVPSPVAPGMRENTILPVFIKRALNDETISIYGKGTRKQNYIDARDIAEAVKRIVTVPAIDGVYNIGSKNVLTNIELAQKCIDTINSRSTIVFSDETDSEESLDWTTDDSKLRGIIGDYQRYSIEKTIIDIADSMK